MWLIYIRFKSGHDKTLIAREPWNASFTLNPPPATTYPVNVDTYGRPCGSGASGSATTTTTIPNTSTTGITYYWGNSPGVTMNPLQTIIEADGGIYTFRWDEFLDSMQEEVPE